jgi:nucleotide-binding universal stress UspA family protein
MASAIQSVSLGGATTVPTLFAAHSLADPPPRGGSSRRSKGPQTEPTAVREVVACLDGSELGSRILPHAQVVARALGAHLTLLGVLETKHNGSGPSDPVDWEIRQREARAHLDGLMAQVGGVERGVCSELIQGRAAEQICSWADRHDVDLTVLCSHGASGLTDWHLASTARKLVDRIPGSLLLVPAAAVAKAGAVRYQQIVVPLDGSPRAERAVTLALRIASSEKAEVLLVHVVPVPQITQTGPLDAEGADLKRRVTEHNHRVATAYLDGLRARTSQVGVRVRVIPAGNESVRTRLERLIREEAPDLVVMSAHGHTGLTGSPCGSVTEYAVTHATTPLLVIRDRVLDRAHQADSSSQQRAERLASSGHTIA